MYVEAISLRLHAGILTLLNTGGAVRDLRHMDGSSERGRVASGNDYFVLTSSRQLERDIFEKYGVINLRPRSLSSGSSQQSRSSRKDNETSRSIRFLCALGGGIAVIAPVAIILFVPGKAVNLITTCAAMVIFAFAIVWIEELRARDVLGLTAAYASVLVVFVGTKTHR